MKIIAKIFGAVVLLVVFTAAVPTSSEPVPLNKAMEVGKPSIVTPSPSSGYSYKAFKKTAEQVKGSKLTLKEKIALKVFGKKIASKSGSNGGKSQLVALLICFFVGTLGIHRFYLGYTWQGVVQLLTLGGCGIWALIDLIRIITGDLKPKDGEYSKTL